MKRLPSLLLALCMLLPGCLQNDSGEESPYNGDEFEGDQLATMFSVESMDGELWHMEEQRGKVVVLAFIYTRCEDTCPLISASIKNVTAQLSVNESANVTFVSITIDPEFDSPSVLQNWTADHGYDWVHLTGNPDTINPILDIYDVDPIHYEDHSHEGYGISHPQPTFIIDAAGYKRVVWTDPELPPDLFLEDLRTVMAL
jgi:protein SCO1/2